MSYPKTKRQKRSRDDNVEIEEDENGGYNAIYIPDMNDSGDSDSDSGTDGESDAEVLYLNNFEGVSKVSFRQVLDSYTENQSQLEPEHTYEWVDGEYKYNESLKNEILLSDSTKKIIRNSSAVELFELFFSKEMKDYIIECTILNGYNLTENELDIFIGILVLTTFNQRKSQKDYWSTDPLLVCPAVSSAMSRNKFMKIKSNLKMNKPDDKNDNDKAWKVRKVLQIFRKNLQQFGFFSTALSIDEMMVKFHGRTNLQQFMQNKPERWAIKEWGIASPEGYLFDCDIYCGKGSNIYSSDKKAKLTKCALGSRVVLLMTQNLLSTVVPRKLIEYHLYFDNYFPNPDLLVHLKKVGLKATGTVRVNRVKVNNCVDKKAEKGTYSVKHDKNSGLNFITVMDSKPVSVLSTAAGVTPLFEVERFSFAEMKRIAILFPNLPSKFIIYLWVVLIYMIYIAVI